MSTNEASEQKLRDLVAERAAAVHARDGATLALERAQLIRNLVKARSRRGVPATASGRP